MAHTTFTSLCVHFPRPLISTGYKGRLSHAAVSTSERFKSRMLSVQEFNQWLILLRELLIKPKCMYRVYSHLLPAIYSDPTEESL